MLPAGHDHGDCADAVKRLYEFLDGELDEAHVALVRRHLDDCAPCLEAFDFEAELRVLVQRRCQDSAPDALRRRITLAIQAEYRFVEGDDGGMSPI